MSQVTVQNNWRAVCAELCSLQPKLERFGVRRLWLFGSRARGDSRPASDWDFLVEFQQPPSFDDFMGLKLLLEDHVGCPVDLLSRQACSQRLLNAIRDQLVDVTQP